MNLTAGTPLQSGKYLINHVLGKSGLSLTLQGTQVQSNSPVIFKTLKPELKGNQHFPLIKQRFNEQAGRFARCQHPGLVRLIETFEEEDVPFAVMDYTPGHSLTEVVQSHGPLPEALAIRYIEQVGSALTIVHQQGLTYRDVTPHNIIRPAGSDIVVLVNFGIAHPAVLGFADGSIPPPAADYAAIEQYQPQLALTPATDIYSLAGTLYFLVTGRPPVAAPHRGNTPLPSPRQLCPRLSPAVEAAILHGLEPNPTSRPQTVMAWLAELNQQNAPVVPAPTPVADRQSATAAAATQSARSAVQSPVLPVSRGQSVQVNSSPSESTSHSPNPIPSPSNGGTNGKQPIHPTMTETRPVPPIAHGVRSAPTPRFSKRFSTVVLTTAAIAAAASLGLGIFLRFAADSTGPGTSFFHSEQSFPPMKDWPGEAAPVAPPSAYTPPALDQNPAPRLPTTRKPSPTPSPIEPSPSLVEPSPEATMNPIVPSPAPAPAPSAAAPEPLPPAIEPAPPAVPAPEPPPPPSTNSR